MTAGGMGSEPVEPSIVELQSGIYTANTSGSGPGIWPTRLRASRSTDQIPPISETICLFVARGWDSSTGRTARLLPPSAAVTATIGGVGTPALFAGLTPTFAGLYQVNLQVPSGVASGNAVPVQLSATDAGTGAAALSNSITIAVQ